MKHQLAHHTTRRPLTVARETIRSLSSGQLARVAGGTNHATETGQFSCQSCACTRPVLE